MSDELAAWPDGPNDPRLEAGTVDVWLSPLLPDPARREALARHLSAAEREREARFHFEADAHRYAIARGLLRELLARYVGEAPGRIELEETDHGRPYRLGGNHPDLDFNLSHSKDLVVYAFARSVRVGIDVEWIHPLDDMDDLVAINFSARERETWSALPPSLRERGFFECWTRKEAFVKAIGEGLSHPLDAFDVSLHPDEPPALLRLEHAPKELCRWSLYALDPAVGYASSLAVEAASATLRCFRVGAGP